MFNKLNNLNKRIKIYKVKMRIYRIVMKYIVGKLYNLYLIGKELY